MEILDLKTLRLEDAAGLPEGYREIIAERREITPELKEKGFGGGVWGKDRRYNWFRKEFGPFMFWIKEQDVNSAEFEGLEFQLQFHVENPVFAPFLKFIREWGRQNCDKGSKLNERFALWLLGQCNLPKETDDNLMYQIPVNNDEVTFKLENENDFLIVLRELSGAFRTLATEHATDPLDLAAEFEYDASELRGMGYWDMANNILTPMVLRGLIEGLAAYRKSGRTDERNISVEVKKRDKAMLFFHGDGCKGEPFYTFEIGAVLTKCLTGIRDEGLQYEAELSHWFSDAAGNMPPKAVEGIRVCIEVPETGGDPVLEN